MEDGDRQLLLKALELKYQTALKDAFATNNTQKTTVPSEPNNIETESGVGQASVEVSSQISVPSVPNNIETSDGVGQASVEVQSEISVPSQTINIETDNGVGQGDVEGYSSCDLEYLATHIERICRGETFLLEFLSQFSTAVLEKVWDVLAVVRDPEKVCQCLETLRRSFGGEARFLLEASF